MATGKIIIQHRYTRDEIRRNPTTLYVFGDNVSRTGYGGQAKEARGEPNSVGIVTKFSPTVYLNDMMVDFTAPLIIEAFNRLLAHLQEGKNIVWPEDGVGTGLAQLNRFAPLTALAIEQCRQKLFSFVEP